MIWLSRKCFVLGQWAWEWGAPLALPRAYCARAPLAVGCFVIMFLGGGDIQYISSGYHRACMFRAGAIFTCGLKTIEHAGMHTTAISSSGDRSHIPTASVRPSQSPRARLVRACKTFRPWRAAASTPLHWLRSSFCSCSRPLARTVMPMRLSFMHLRARLNLSPTFNQPCRDV